MLVAVLSNPYSFLNNLNFYSDFSKYESDLDSEPVNHNWDPNMYVSCVRLDYSCQYTLDVNQQDQV